MRKLGIIAGGGTLPGTVMRVCLKQKRPFFVVALKGFCDETLLPKGIDVIWSRMGSVGTMERALKKAGVQDLMLIGSVRRPSVRELCPDLSALRFLLKIGFKARGDNGLLSAVVHEIESRGLRVVGVHDVVPSLIVQKGVYGAFKPDKKNEADIAHGIHVAKILGAADVGQSVVIQQGLVLAVEAIEGTDALLKRVGSLTRRGHAGVLVKVMKPHQERRADLPTIGPNTVQGVFDAGLKGIAVEAGSSLLAEPEKTIALADKLGIFIVGVETVCQK